VHERRAHAAHRAVDSAGAVDVHFICTQEKRLASRTAPLRVRAADDVVNLAVRELRGTHAGKRRDDVELQIPAREVAPDADQDLVRQELLQFAPQLDVQLVVPPDQQRSPDDVQKTRALRLAEGVMETHRFLPATRRKANFVVNAATQLARAILERESHLASPFAARSRSRSLPPHCLRCRRAVREGRLANGLSYVFLLCFFAPATALARHRLRIEPDTEPLIFVVHGRRELSSGVTHVTLRAPGAHDISHGSVM